MNAVWVDEGSGLDAARCRAHGITAPYFSHREAGVTAAYLDSVAQQGFAPGIYSAWNWRTDLDGPGYAQYVSDELKRINWKGNAPVQLDIEDHDIAGYVLPCLRRWRQLRPTRPTSWTLEGFQGGLFTGAQVAEFVSLKIGLCVQLYDGGMNPLQHSPILDMLMQGFPGTLLSGFYNAAALPYRWNGWAFTQATLP